MIVYWAHVDQDGKVASHGSCDEGDVFRQKLDEGCTCIVRPENVTCFSNHVFNFEKGEFENGR